MLVTIGVAQSAKNAYCIHNDDSDLRFGYGFLPFFSVREKCPYFNIERSPTENKQNGLITICDHFKMLPVFCSLVFFFFIIIIITNTVLTRSNIETFINFLAFPLRHLLPNHVLNH